MTSEPEAPSGQIFTFYSYKGGTGRSMALANTGVLLARRWSDRRKVLLIDWDLEAPGLHRFFENQLSRKTNLEKQPGLIELFCDLRLRLGNIEEAKGELQGTKVIEELNLDRYITKTSIPSLFLMTAGRLDKGYPARVNSFNWEEFFNKFPWAIRKFSETLSEKYRYVLVDSRTGITDISGICTTLLPEKLVLVFTPNNQSLTGVLDLIQSATEYRKQSDDLRPLIVFPLVSRVESSEPKLREDWRLGNPSKRIRGFQKQFETALKRVYELPRCSLMKYFDEVQIQQAPHYAYGEEIAVLSERTDDRLSLTRSYENLATRLVSRQGPWEDLTVTEFVGRPTSKKRRLRVFLSYASADFEKTEELFRRLNDDGFEPWLDKESLLPGQTWSLEIKRVISRSDAALFCLSKNSISKGGSVQKELRYALDIAYEMPPDQSFIIPVRLEETELPSELADLQSVDYFLSDKERAYEKIVQALRRRAAALGISVPPKKGKRLTDPLSNRQWEILGLRSEGKSLAEIAVALTYSRATVSNYMVEIYRRIKVKNSIEAVKWFQQNAVRYGHSNIFK